MSLVKVGQLAWRNLWRQRRRNVTMLVALSFAVMGVVFLNAFLRGMTAQMADSAVNNMQGHVKVLQPGYLDDPGIDKSFVLESEWSRDTSGTDAGLGTTRAGTRGDHERTGNARDRVNWD